MPRKPTGRPAGRPKGSGRLTSNRVTMTLAPGQLEALEHLAETRGVKMNVILREAVARYLKDEGPKGG